VVVREEAVDGLLSFDVLDEDREGLKDLGHDCGGCLCVNNISLTLTGTGFGGVMVIGGYDVGKLS
jgi:hypothetical protein